LILPLAALLLPACHRPGLVTVPQANIVLVTLDTLKRDAVGCYGNPEAYTPGLDRLSRRAVVALGARAPLPLTVPSHSSLFTARYPAEHGVERNSQLLSGEALTLAERLRAAGYSTAALTAALLRYPTGLEQGFDIFTRRERPETSRLVQFVKLTKDHSEDLENAARAEELIGELREPFFLWVHLYGIHRPYEPPAPYDRLYPGQEDDVAVKPDEADGEAMARWLRNRRAEYLGEVSHADRLLERIVRATYRQGLARRTILVALSDHGEDLREKTSVLGHGTSTYHTEMTVPLLLGFPGLRRSKLLADDVELLDVTPTLIGYLGLPPLPGEASRNLWPRVRSQVLRLDRPQVLEAKHVRGILDSGYKLMLPEDGPPLLFDLESDPGEERDIGEEHPALAEALQKRLRARFAELRRRRLAAEEDLSPEKREALEALGYLE
jgi:arylsulfatase A-like enzyme